MALQRQTKSHNTRVEYTIKIIVSWKPLSSRFSKCSFALVFFSASQLYASVTFVGVCFLFILVLSLFFFDQVKQRMQTEKKIKTKILFVARFQCKQKCYRLAVMMIIIQNQWLRCSSIWLFSILFSLLVFRRQRKIQSVEMCCLEK